MGWLLAPSFLAAQNVDAAMDKLVLALQKGDADALNGLLAESLEVTAPPNTDGEYSKNQALFILKEFFVAYRVQAFQVVHKGTSGSTPYLVGRYTAAQGEFVTNIFLRQQNGQYRIDQIRFEQG